MLLVIVCTDIVALGVVMGVVSIICIVLPVWVIL